MDSCAESPKILSPMPSPGLSPSFRNMRCHARQSPVEIKEKLRQSYKERIRNSRQTLFSKMRGPCTQDMRSMLSEILWDMFGSDYPSTPQDEEYQFLEIIKEEILQDEMNWLSEEYEKSNMENIDWGSLESADEMVCPTCQKVNLVKYGNNISCTKCNWMVNTNKTILKAKLDTYNAIEAHQLNCNKAVQFAKVTDLNEEHIFLICEKCLDMRLIL